MNYLRTYEDFYRLHSPIASFKSNIGTEIDSLAGANSFPYNTFSANEEDMAFKKGQEDFKKGISLNENPFVDQQYPNTTLIKAWNDGWNNQKLNKNIYRQ